VPYSDFLDELLALEIRSKAEKHLTMRVSMARFPFQKTLAFDFTFQPSIDPKVIRELATGPGEVGLEPRGRDRIRLRLHPHVEHAAARVADR
jgi:DNA replication protein DnaC